MLVRHPAEIVAEREHRAVLSLPLAGAAQYLEVILVDHPQSRRADRVAEAFQPAVDLAWDGAVGVVKAVEHVAPAFARSEEHTSELQSLMRISYAVFCLKKKKSTH